MLLFHFHQTITQICVITQTKLVVVQHLFKSLFMPVGGIIP